MERPLVRDLSLIHPGAESDSQRGVVPKATPLRTDPARRRIGRPTAVGALTGKAAGPALASRGFGSADVISHWPTIVGGELSAFAAPVRVKFPKGKSDHGTLVLKVMHGAAATLIHLKTPSVLERVNRFFGYNAIHRVEVSQGPLPAGRRPAKAAMPLKPLAADRQARVDGAVADVGPPELKQALKRLGEAVQRRTA